METKQQQETLNYFDAFAKDWKEKAMGQKHAKVNIINQRHGYVVEVVKSRTETRKTLDVGCGNGELVHDIAKLNIPAVGIDFAKEMIKQAREISEENKLAFAEFICGSFFEQTIEDGSFDVISANGFIEYISHEQLEDFITISGKALSKGGSLVMGSRNRLYNVTSMNPYTTDEINSENAVKLLKESVQIAAMKDMNDLLKIDSAPLEDPEKTHHNTGIGVTTRYQFTPSQLARMLHAKGFEVKELCPIHIHTMSPEFKTAFPEFHYSVSNMLSSLTNDNKESRNMVIPYSSSFMIHAVKI